jgi:hypothetical protein
LTRSKQVAKEEGKVAPIASAPWSKQSLESILAPFFWVCIKVGIDPPKKIRLCSIDQEAKGTRNVL